MNWDIIAHLVMCWHVLIVSVCSMVSICVDSSRVYALLSVYYAGCVLCELKVDMYVAHMSLGFF